MGDELQIGRETEAALIIGRPESRGDEDSRVPIKVRSAGLVASGWADLESWNGGARALVDYFTDLAENWRGWTGAKEWRDAGATLALSATHDGIGGIVVRVDLRTLPYEAPGSWGTVAMVPLEPGEMERVAMDLRAWLLT
jgi:hypothetical protein